MMQLLCLGGKRLKAVHKINARCVEVDLKNYVNTLVIFNIQYNQKDFCSTIELFDGHVLYIKGDARTSNEIILRNKDYKL